MRAPLAENPHEILSRQKTAFGDQTVDCDRKSRARAARLYHAGQKLAEPIGVIRYSALRVQLYTQARIVLSDKRADALRGPELGSTRVPAGLAGGPDSESCRGFHFSPRADL